MKLEKSVHHGSISNSPILDSYSAFFYLRPPKSPMIGGGFSHDQEIRSDLNPI